LPKNKKNHVLNTCWKDFEFLKQIPMPVIKTLARQMWSFCRRKNVFHSVTFSIGKLYRDVKGYTRHVWCLFTR